MGLTRPRASQIYNLDYKQATRVVTTTNITLVGGAPSVVDGVTLSLNDRVLVTGQNTGSQNGIYFVSTVGSGSTGTWTLAYDDNTTGEVDAGMIVMVTEGSVYADTQWKLITDNPIVIGTTALTFTQNYLANAIIAGTSNVSVQSNANVTISSAGTANVLTVSSTGTVVKGTESVTGNITAGNVLTGGLLSVTGNIYTGNILTNGYFYANGTAFGGGGGGTPGGANTQIQYNNAGAFGGSAAFTFNNTTNTIATTGIFSATGNITGGNILTGGIISASGNIATTGNITAGGYITNSTYISTNTLSAVGAVITGNITGGNILTAGIVSSTGNATHGNLITAGTLTVNSGNAVTAIVNGGGNGVGNIGSSTATFNTIFAKATTAQYADLAEMYCADDFYPPGTVVEFGGTSEITITTTSHSTAVAGIISTNPSYLMNSTIACEINAVEVALVGRVPCQVVGTIRKGDRLVSSKIPGTAQAMNPALYEPGCIVGKALEDYNSAEPGIIEVAVGRI